MIMPPTSCLFVSGALGALASHATALAPAPLRRMHGAPKCCLCMPLLRHVMTVLEWMDLLYVGCCMLGSGTATVAAHEDLNDFEALPGARMPSVARGTCVYYLLQADAKILFRI